MKIMKQIVAHKKIGALHGILLVLGLTAALILLNYLVLGFLSTYIGNNASSLAFWALGGLIAWAVLRVYVVKYSYELGDDVLRLNRAYGKRERHIEDIYLRQLVFLGAPDEAKRRYPNAKKVKAVRSGAEDPVVALAYKTSDGHRIALIQANSALKAALKARMKEK